LAAIASLLFGAANLLSCTCCGGASLIAGPVFGMSQVSPEIDGHQHPSQPRELFKEMDTRVTGYTVVMVLGVVVELLLGIVVLAGGVGLLAMHRWARWAVLTCAVLLAGWQLLAVVYQVTLVNPALEAIRLNSAGYNLPWGYFGQPVGVQSLFRIAMLLLTLAFAATAAPLLLPAVGRAFAAPAEGEVPLVHPLGRQ
jgi:hypothetical protein